MTFAETVAVGKGELIDVFLQPGQYCVGGADYRIRTLLGSCVSIILWHPGRRIGAMSHFLLPSRLQPTAELDAYYGEEALQLMLLALRREKVLLPECQAKIFGGGNMFPEQTRSVITNVGEKNGLAARQLLAAHHIPIVREDLFGIGHRKIHFNVASGDVWVRQVDLADIKALAAAGAR